LNKQSEYIELLSEDKFNEIKLKLEVIQMIEDKEGCFQSIKGIANSRDDEY